MNCIMSTRQPNRKNHDMSIRPTRQSYNRKSLVFFLAIIAIPMFLAIHAFSADMVNTSKEMPGGESNAVESLRHLPIIVDSTKRASRGFIGFGAEWDSSSYDNCGVGAEDFAVELKRIKYMKLPVVRIMIQTKWCYLGDDRYDFDSRAMQLLYRHLDFCQEEGITVILTDWGCEPGWLRIPGVKNTEDPKYAEIIGVYLDYLINKKGYTCIRYFVLGNEPNLEVRNWSRWKTGFCQVRKVLIKRKLDRYVTIAGPDESIIPPIQDIRSEKFSPSPGIEYDWIFRAADELQDIPMAYDIHIYALNESLSPGKLQDCIEARWEYVRQEVSSNKNKIFIVGELGMFEGSKPPSANEHVDTFWFGLCMADCGVQSARAGSHAICAWMLSDNSHKGFLLGMWKNKESGIKLRPWFYTWSLLSRYFPSGSDIYAPDQPGADVRILVGRAATRGATAEHAFSICIVNRGERATELGLRIPEAERDTYKRFLYQNDNMRINAQGYPLPVETVSFGPAQGIQVECPAESMILLTSVPF